MEIKIINTLYIGFILKLNYDSNIKCNEKWGLNMKGREII